MKKICLLLFILLLTTRMAFSQSFWDDMASGSWEGTGTLLGSEAEFDMKWAWELNGKFLKLEFQNKRTSNSGEELILKSHAYYQPKNDTLFEGTWLDSRGVTFPIRGILKDSTFTVKWGSPETEQGKTIYTLISGGKAKVTDYFLQGENFVKFGEAEYENSNTSNLDRPMKRVTGIGGLFFKTKDPEETKKWYRKHLGIESGKYGGTFEWRHADAPDKKGFTAWGPFSMESDYYEPSKKEFMFNYRVENLEKLLEVLEEEGVEIVGEMEVFEYGKFGWIMDPNGIKIELWEPNDEEYDKIKGETNSSS